MMARAVAGLDGQGLAAVDHRLHYRGHVVGPSAVAGHQVEHAIDAAPARVAGVNDRRALPG